MIKTTLTVALLLVCALSHAQFDEQDEDKTMYKVLINHEEQYSIWPADREIPFGWNFGGKEGTKQECLEYIEDVWTDMRPLSLRKHMEYSASKKKPNEPDSNNY